MLLVIGYGNPLRGDDGVGQIAARRLSERPLADQVEVLPCHQLTPELAWPISRADLVIFIDAGLDQPPGAVACRPIEPLEAGGAWTHAASPSALLAGALELYGARPRALLVSIGVASLDYHEQLSEPVSAALQRVTWMVEQLITAELTRPRAAVSTAAALSQQGIEQNRRDPH